MCILKLILKQVQYKDSYSLLSPGAGKDTPHFLTNTSLLMRLDGSSRGHHLWYILSRIPRAILIVLQK